MPELYNLKVHLKMVKDKKRNHFSAIKYGLKSNNYIKKVLIKLKQLNLIDKFIKKKEKVYLNPTNLKSVELYHRPTEILNMNNYRLVSKQKLKDSFKSTLLLTTNKGLKTLKQALDLKIGGYVIGILHSNKNIS